MKSIKCKLNDSMSFVMYNIVKRMGHDDSFPFEAQLALERNGQVEELGCCWDDGWGGEVNALVNPDKRVVWKEIEDIIKTHTWTMPEEVLRYCPELRGKEYEYDMPFLLSSIGENGWNGLKVYDLDYKE